MTTDNAQRLLTFRSGGWVLLLAGVFALGIFIWALAGALVRIDRPLIGDLRNVDSYGFDLQQCRVRRELIAPGMRKDALKALVDPAVIAGSEVKRINEESYGKYLVSTDRVIGVVLNGESRAYPLMILEVHEIANDILGGLPIVVTYNPLCDSVVVFERTVDGETMEFGVSGLVYNSNLLMFDRRPDAVGESLWSQLLGRAISGPAVDTSLAVVTAELVSWSDWLTDHPDTTVLDPDPRMKRRYKETAYELYFRSPNIKYPVDPLPGVEGLAVKDLVVVVDTDEQRGVYPVAAIGDLADTTGIWETTLGATPLRFRYRAVPPTVVVWSPDAAVRVRYAFWFAWHAMYPQDQPATPPSAES